MNEQDIMKFFESLDRKKFLTGSYKNYAHIDCPLPIGHDQTISQPTLVLEMTRVLWPEKDSRVLEIGTGCGYQTAFLAEFSKEVFTIEIIENLSKDARKRLEKLGYSNISYKVADGSSGWKEEAPFDRIIVTAAAGKRPKELIDQLANNGRMVVPVGPLTMQDLLLITKDEFGNISEESLGNVRFVEMVGQYGWDSDNSE